MRILIACECSGVVRDAFIARGHDAWSCDIKPTKRPGPHYQCDVLKVLEMGGGWDLMICHPDCTYLATSGIHWNCRTVGRVFKTREGIRFAETLWKSPIDRIALENPIGCLATHSELMECSQIIQPYDFGDDASKATCLWLKNLPLLTGTEYVAPRIVIDKDGKRKKRWANQTDSGQNRLGPSDTRKAERSQTYQGIANAMAEQWGSLAI